MAVAWQSCMECCREHGLLLRPIVEETGPTYTQGKPETESPTCFVTAGEIARLDAYMMNIGISFLKETNLYSSVTGHLTKTLTSQNGGRRQD